jgi:rhodanese-related sulfurtransferase
MSLFSFLRRGDKPQPTQLGRFQLENLISQPLRFHYFDLRKEKRGVKKNEGVSHLLEPALSLSSKTLLEEVSARVDTKDQPIVLLCENGRLSRRVARVLIDMDYKNVCVITRGVRGLTSE